ncbi:CAAX prenyl protease 1 [Podochytrium sp. JEL0797]|nr:CAAX prenyl protease 1 [Podochytrium sp. JEL0797]
MFHIGLHDIPLKETVLCISWAIYGFKTYLQYRQHRRLANPALGVPLLLKSEVTEEEHAKAKAYQKDKSSFEFVSSLFNQLVATATLVFDVLPKLWGVAGSLLQVAGLTGSREILQSIVFGSMSVTLSTLIGIPFALYSTFVIEERWGFNKQTIGLFISDKIKEVLLVMTLTAPLTAGGIKVIQWGGKNFVFFAGAFVLFFQLVLILLFPTVIAPLFNKFTPLEEGELKTEINKLAKSVDFPLTKLFVIDGSKRSSHSNAYFTGLFKDKRIVLFDTLLEQMNTKEILAVLAHELGHWKMSHIVRTLALSQIHILITFYAFSQVIDSSVLYTSFGFQAQPTMIGFILFNYLYEPIDFVAGFAFSHLSRVHEFEADQYAKKLGYAEELKSGLIKLNKKNLGNLIPDPWFSAWNYSHPPMVERLSAIDGKKKTE